MTLNQLKNAIYNLEQSVGKTAFDDDRLVDTDKLDGVRVRCVVYPRERIRSHRMELIKDKKHKLVITLPFGENDFVIYDER